MKKKKKVPYRIENCCCNDIPLSPQAGLTKTKSKLLIYVLGLVINVVFHSILV